jgi:phosphoribosylformimino-5-aminoimidazole carboxamide ribotide isomerase
VLVTAVDVEGRLEGPDLPLMRSVMNACSQRVIASGGIATLDDLRALATLGLWGAVIGMALYTGHMDAARCARDFGGTNDRDRA